VDVHSPPADIEPESGVSNCASRWPVYRQSALTVAALLDELDDELLELLDDDELDELASGLDDRSIHVPALMSFGTSR
jgi:hypothetical protein